MTQKRRLKERVRRVGEEVEESLRQDGENKRLEHATNESLYHVDQDGVPVTTLSRKLAKRQKLAEKDPLFSRSKINIASNALNEKIRKHKKQLTVSPKPDTIKVSNVPTLWHEAPSITKAQKERQSIKSTRNRVRAVEIASSGQSYHPEFHAHQDVVAQAYAEQLEQEERRENQFAGLNSGISDETLQFLDRSTSDDELSVTDERDFVIPIKRNATELVTKSKRNRQKRHRQMLTQHASQRKEKKLLKQINCVQELVREIEAEECAQLRSKQLKSLIAEQKLDEEPKVRIGKKFVKLFRGTDVAFAGDLTGSMRTLNPIGNVLLDRFDSLHKRNLIQLNSSRRPKKAKLKIITK